MEGTVAWTEAAVTEVVRAMEELAVEALVATVAKRAGAVKAEEGKRHSPTPPGRRWSRPPVGHGR